MKITYFNRKEGIAKVIPESLDDLWHISKISEIGDIAGAMSSRKVKRGGEQGRQKATRRPSFFKIRIKKIDLDFTSEHLRLSGEIVEGPEEVSLSSAHTLDIEVGSKLDLVKERWKAHQIDRLNRAKRKVSAKVLVCAFDDDKAYFAALSDSGVRELGEIELSLARKTTMKGAEKAGDYNDLVAALRNFYNSSNPSKVVVASPAFWKDELFKRLKVKDASLAKKVSLERVSSASLSGIKELLKKGIGESALAEESEFMEEVRRRIAKNGAVAYGFAEVKASVPAIEKLAVSEKLIDSFRKKGRYGEIEQLVDSVEAGKGKVFVIDNRDLDGLGGAVALLRYKVDS